ncbi:MAG: amidohydrolase family protein [Synergistes jonesii]|uniref:amidohydrolase family protein n=1 Tax=Synergistes jonesii TaxID=2754 RepID=UPI002A758B74|nr:amidohydrolase family protein [Synergistes jonesii]MDY2983711.1 amidohydrolase family protein [Synergistes jonesii]
MANYIIKCGRLYDGLTDELRPNVEILVVDKKIEEVASHVVVLKDAQVVDLSDATVTPGLIDAHVHFNIGDWKKLAHDTVYQGRVYKGMFALYNAERALRRGFTTVRHCGSDSDDGFSVVTAKRMINSGYFDGARMFVAPHLVSVNAGHGDTSWYLKDNPIVSDLVWEKYPGRGCGSAEFREVVRCQSKFGGDLISVATSGGFNSIGDNPEQFYFTDEELDAVIGAAHQIHQKVYSNSHTVKNVRKEVAMGIDGIERGSLIDDPELLVLMEQRGVDFVPTFASFDCAIYGNQEELALFMPEAKEKLGKYSKQMAAARGVIVENGIEFGYGSGFVAVHHPYQSGFEYKSMLKSGVCPFRALAAATRVNARIIGKSKELGAVAPGYMADIAAWKRDLMTDENALLDCAFVMKEGISYETEKDVK